MTRPEFEESLEYLVLPTDECLRIDRFVARLYPQFSRTLVQKTIEEGLLEVNGKTVKSNYLVIPGDLIVVLDVPIAEMNLTPEDIPLDIVFEDDDLLVVNKPAGMVVHPAPGAYEHTLVNALLFHVKALSGVNGPVRPGIVHRIDKDTSGLLMVAKTDFAHAKLAEELARKATKREYVGLVDGVIGNDRGTIDMPIGRDPKDRKRMAAVEGGKRAVTHFLVLERFRDKTLVQCILETGRTHQIRVHLAKIGHPVTNDPVYNTRQPDPGHGQFLHAQTLGFTHPRTGIVMEFAAPLPAHFQNFLEGLRQKNS
jgi:23S rRNA pseudouridine1911/1915/1917 synthase